MTNREIAEKLLRSLWVWTVARQSEDVSYSEEDRGVDLSSIEQAINSAKRAGKIEALEWVLDGNTDWLTELDRLRAEQGKERP
jgi:tRNA A-37 threonylcarbamoyl transferase component Bud32